MVFVDLVYASLTAQVVGEYLAAVAPRWTGVGGLAIARRSAARDMVVRLGNVGGSAYLSLGSLATLPLRHGEHKGVQEPFPVPSSSSSHELGICVGVPPSASKSGRGRTIGIRIGVDLTWYVPTRMTITSVRP